MPPGVAELLADGGPYALSRERLFAEDGLDWDLGSPGLREAWTAGDYSKFHGWDQRADDGQADPAPGAVPS